MKKKHNSEYLVKWLKNLSKKKGAKAYFIMRKEEENIWKKPEVREALKESARSGVEHIIITQEKKWVLDYMRRNAHVDPAIDEGLVLMTWDRKFVAPYNLMYFHKDGEPNPGFEETAALRVPYVNKNVVCMVLDDTNVLNIFARNGVKSSDVFKF